MLCVYPERPLYWSTDNLAGNLEKETHMFRTLKFGLAGLLVAGTLVALVVTGSALAQDTPQADTAAVAPIGRGGYAMGTCGQAGLEAAAQALGLTVDEMSTQLWGGRTLADLADRAGVDLQVVQDAMQNACKDQLRDAVEQAVTDGTLTRDKADWLLEGLDKGFWGAAGDGPAFGGFMMGARGMGKGFGGFMGPQAFGNRDQGSWGPGQRSGGMRGPGGMNPGGMGMGRWGGAQPGAQAPTQ